jgi:thiosulfate reductase/polysulfide reductase chain A
MTTLSRRRFLQISASAVGGLAAPAGTSSPPSARSPTLPGTQGLTEVATFCEMCFWRCGGIATVRDGQLWKFEGNPRDPMSQGRLCPRGTAAVGAHRDPDRLRQPLLRKGERGKETWAAVSWDEALDFVAQKMQAIKAQHGAESIAMFNHGLGVRFIQHVLKSYGCINFVAPAFAQCRGPRDTGFMLAYGTELGSPEPTDIENARCLVLIGSHLGENMHNTQVQEFARAVERRANIIVVDPRYSVAASKARHWLPIKPGTDLALVLAWMNVLVSEGLYDREFVGKYGHGFDKFGEAIRTATPEWAQEQTGIDAATIRLTAREIAAARPASLVHPGRRVNWNGDDTQRSRAIALLNALLGNWGRKGGFFLPRNVDVASVPLPKPPASTRPRADNPEGKRYPFAAHAAEGVTTGLREATLTGQPYPIKAWWIYATDILHALPNPAETLKAIDQLDLLVVVDTMPSEIAGYADVVLPEATFLERHDELLAGWGRRGWVALRQPVVPPPHDQKPGWWIAKQLAGKLGIAQAMPFEHIEQYLAARCDKSGIDYAQLKREGVFVGEAGPIYIDDGAEFSFDTPSGKVEFYAEQLKAAGFDPVPRYVSPPQVPPGFYRLVTGRAPIHTFSRTQSNPYLASLMPENEIWVHASTAAAAGLKHGARVKLANQDGVTSNPVKVRVTQRIRPDTVYMVYGFGHSNPLRKSAYLMGADAAQLTTRYTVDPLMGGTSIHGNAVRFVKEA